MASRIEHRASFAHGVDAVLAAQTDAAALRARLAEIGGVNATLEEHSATADGVRYTLLQGIPAAQLPQTVRTIHKGDLVVQREHTWTRSGGQVVGAISAHVNGVPGEITARTELTALTGDGPGCLQVTRGEVKVRIPIVGGKLEGVIAEQVTNLLEREAEFTASWLGRG